MYKNIDKNNNELNVKWLSKEGADVKLFNAKTIILIIN